jgi:hypothetical protein
MIGSFYEPPDAIEWFYSTHIRIATPDGTVSGNSRPKVIVKTERNRNPLAQSSAFMGNSRKLGLSSWTNLIVSPFEYSGVMMNLQSIDADRMNEILHWTLPFRAPCRQAIELCENQRPRFQVKGH